MFTRVDFETAKGSSRSMSNVDVWDYKIHQYIFYMFNLFQNPTLKRVSFWEKIKLISFLSLKINMLLYYSTLFVIDKLYKLYFVYEMLFRNRLTEFIEYCIDHYI